MSESRWHDSDPRPPFGNVPGPGFRPARYVPEPAPRERRRPGDGKPAAWEGPGWYREDPGPGEPRPGPSSPPPSQPGASRQPGASQPAPSGFTDPFRAVPMASPRPAGPEDRRGDPGDRRPVRRPEAGPGRRPEAGPGRRPEAERDPRAVREPESDQAAGSARSWRWGQWSGGPGTGIVVIAAVLGALVTVATKHDPGTLLGAFVLAGSVAAGFAVRPRSVYLLIPVPVLCYLVFALAAGLVRDHATSSTSGLTVNAAQWIANGFLAMAAATVVLALITGGRWLWARRTGQAGAGARSEPSSRPHSQARDTRDIRDGREARPEPEADRGGLLRGGTPPEPSFRPDPAWTDDRWERPGPGNPLDQGGRWAQGDDSGGRNYRDERGFGGQDRGGPDRGAPDRGAPDRGAPDRGRDGDPRWRGSQDRADGQWGRGGQNEDQWRGGGPDRGGRDYGARDDFWDRGPQDRRRGRGSREPGDQGPGDWRRRPPGPPSFGSPRNLAPGARRSAGTHGSRMTGGARVTDGKGRASRA
jgi:hypothetical protein